MALLVGGLGLLWWATRKPVEVKHTWMPDPDADEDDRVVVVTR